MRHRLLIGTTLLTAVLSSALVSAGCKGGANPFAAFDPRAAALAALSDEIKTAVKGYLSGLDGVIASAAEARDFSSALTALEKLKPYYDDVRTYAPQLQQLSATDLENVRIAFGPEIKKAEADLKAQVERVTGTGSISNILKPLLEKVPTLAL